MVATSPVITSICLTFKKCLNNILVKTLYCLPMMVLTIKCLNVDHYLLCLLQWILGQVEIRIFNSIMIILTDSQDLIVNSLLLLLHNSLYLSYENLV